MFEEAQLYAPLVYDEDGGAHVVFTPDHPGFGDPAYQAERDAIAAAALAHAPGAPPPDVAYSAEADDCWRTISAALAERHKAYACAEMRAANARLDLPKDRIPQLSEVSASLRALTGFGFAPAAGLVPLADFYGSFADHTFPATQFVRHHRQPYFSPEPDMVHEVIGHGTMLARDRTASLYELIGATARGLRTQEALQALSDVFWFTMEYGVVREDGELRAYGASLLSSYGELEEFRSVTMRPLDADAMIAQTYDVTAYQPVLFCAESVDHLEDFLRAFCGALRDAPSKAGER